MYTVHCTCSKAHKSKRKKGSKSMQVLSETGCDMRPEGCDMSPAVCEMLE
jgi:hypothetical protein